MGASFAHVWQFIAAPRPIDAMRNTPLTECEVEGQLCARDLVAPFQDRARGGLVEIRNAAGP